jgi:TRAP-type mannitol/chloroaromatic compound transport system permease small subunit
VSADGRPTPQHHEHGAPQAGAPHTSAFGAVTQGLNIVGTVLILVMAVAVNADVIGRDFFNHPIPGVLEFIGLAIVAVVFLQMANTLREDRHVSNDLLMLLVSQSRPRLAAGIYMVFDLIGAMLMAIIVIYVWPLLVRDYEGGFYAGTAGVIEIPIWPFKAVVIVGAAVTALQFLALARRHFVQARGGGQV